MHIILINEEGKSLKRKVGFSWTAFFFLFFPALFRKDWPWFGIFLLLVILSCTISYFLDLNTLGLILSLLFGFTYNKLNIRQLLKKRYKPETLDMENILRKKRYIDSNKSFFETNESDFLH